MKNLLIEFKNVDLGYGKKKIVTNLNWSIYQEDFLGIVGPNGSGKTTILRGILGILRPQKGEIILHNNGQQIRIGYVPQRESLDPIMPFTVFDIVMMGRYGRLGLFKFPGKKDKDKVWDALEHVDINNLAHAPFKELSGGQKQRTLIARAIASEPNVLILDEPTNGMDLPSRMGILDLIKHFHSEHQILIIMVSHLLNDVANYVERIALVEKNVFQIGPVDEILSVKNLSKLYNIEIKVGECNGIKFIAAGGTSV